MEFPNLSGVRQIVLDYEANMLKYWHPDFRLLGAAIAVPGQEWYFDFKHHPGLAQWLRDTLPGKTVVAQNAQFEYQGTRTLGVDPRSCDWYCTMVAECLINEHHFEYNLSAICDHWGIPSQKKAWQERIREALGAKSIDEAMSRLDEAPFELVSGYAKSDAHDAFRIKCAQIYEIERQELHRVVDLEMQLLPVLCDMSWGGVRVDLEAAHAAIPVLDTKEAAIAAEIRELVGCKDASTFVNSPKQMREFFKPDPVNRFQWRLIDGTLVGPTKGGKGPSLGQDALRAMQHPVAAKILDLRKTIKLRDTFIRGHILGSADDNGYVHTQFNQARNDADAGTVTGRLSSTDPALQQITKRDKQNAAILRAMFLPDPGQAWLCEDYSQVDFRCAAHLINDPKIIAAFQADPSLDYHQVVSDMTGIPRNPAYAGAPNTKQINLGLAFGAGAGKLSFMMGMEYELGEYKGKMVYYPGPEAKRIFDLYHSKLPGVRKFMKDAENVAKSRGFVRTLIGRRLRFDRSGGEHKAAGLLYQAYAADLHKVGLVEVDHVIRSERLPARLLASIHDEIGNSADPDPAVAERIRLAYTDFHRPESRIRMRVPITASADFGPNWYEASKN